MTPRTRRVKCITAVTALATIAVGLLMALLWFDASDVSLAQEGPAHTVVPGDIHLQITESVSGTITIQKVTVPSGSTSEFTFAATYSATGFTLSDGGASTSGPLDEGTYAVTEAVSAGWNLSGIACQGGLNSTWADNLGTRSVEIVLAEGEDVTCVFTNTQQASLEVEKILVGQAPDSAWGFTGDLGPFSIPAIGGTEIFSPSGGSYTISETIKAGYDVAVSCDSGESGSDGVTVDLAPAEDVTCVFTNTRQTGQLTVTKDVDPDAAGTNWNIEVTGPSPFTDTLSGDDTTGARVVSTGLYTITETAGTGTNLDDYDTTYICSGDVASSGTGTSISVEVGTDQAITCTFTNTRKTGQLEVVKALEPITDPGRFGLWIDDRIEKSEASHGDTTGKRTVTAGQHSVRETQGRETYLEDYDSSISCVDASGVQVASGDGPGPLPVTVAGGDDIVCTITNTRKMGELTVMKDVVPDDSNTNWEIEVDGSTFFIETLSGDDTTGPRPVNVGIYRITEAAGSGTSLDDYGTTWACTNGIEDLGTQIVLDVDQDEAITCTFTNTRKAGQLEVVKALEPPNDPGLFNLRIDGIDVVTDVTDEGTTGKKSVPTGVHTVGETAGTETDLDSYDTVISCVDQGGQGATVASATNVVLEVAVDEDDDVVCTITNTLKMGELTVMKDVVPDDPNTNWEIEVDGPTSFTETLRGDDSTGPRSVNPGIYRITEAASSGTSLDDYRTTWACTNGIEDLGTQIVLGVDPGKAITCTFTNTRRTGQLEVVKALEPPTDPGLFNLQIDGTDIQVNVADGGTTGKKSVSTGEHIVGETAGTDTDLGDYDTTISCVDQGGLGTVVASAPDVSLSVTVEEDDDIVCTIANKAYADLTIAKTGEPSTVDAGDVLNYAILVTNNGPASAQNVVVTDFLPSGVTYQEDTDACSEDLPGVLTCRLGMLGATESASFGVDVVVSADAGNAITNTVTVTTATHDPVPDNNEASEVTLVAFNPAIKLQKDGPPSSTVGYNVLYEFFVSNDDVAGDGSPIINPTVNDNIAGPCTLRNGDDGDRILQLGETWFFTARYTVQPGYAGQALVNEATAHGTDLDGDPVTATATHTMTIDFSPGVEIQKTGPLTSAMGALITYTVTITNTSMPANAPDLVLESLLDGRAGDLTTRARHGGCGTLSYGETCTFAYPYTVQGGDPDPLINTVEAHYEPVGVTLPITDVASHTLDLFHPLLWVTKDGPEQSEFGDVVTYTVTIANDSSSDTPFLSLVNIADSLKGDLTSADNVVSSTCTDGLGIGDQCQIIYTHTVQPGDPMPLVNTVLVESQPAGFASMVTASAVHSMGVTSFVYLPNLMMNYPPPWEKSVGLPVGVEVRALAVCPSDPKVMYAGFGESSFGVYKSIDAGAHWIPTSLLDAQVYGIAVAPGGCNTVYAAAWAAGVMKSVNEGGSWFSSSNNLPAFVYSVVVDPLDSNVVYAGTPDQGVYRSLNAGASWSKWGLYSPSAVADLRFAPGGQALYAAKYGEGVYKRVRIGPSWTEWQPVNNGIISAHRDIFAVSVDQQSSSTVFAASRSDGIYRTRNSGSSWTRVLPLNLAYDVLVDPGDGDVVYAAASDGVYRSDEGGDPESWGTWNTGLVNLVARTLVIGPDDAQYIHVGTADGAWRRFR